MAYQSQFSGAQVDAAVQQLLNMSNNPDGVPTSLVGYRYMGLATLSDPSTLQEPKTPCYWLASEVGTYANLGGVTVAEGDGVVAIMWSGSWQKKALGIASLEEVRKLSQEMTEKASAVLRRITGEDFTFNGYILPDGRYYEVTGSDFYATDFIAIMPHCDITTQYLQYNNQYTTAIAFYSDNTPSSFISGISNIGVNPQDGYNIPYQDIPQGAKYVRFTLFKTKDAAWASIQIHNPQEGIANGFLVPEIKETADYAKALSKSNSVKLATTMTRVAGLDDQDYYSSSYSQYGIGEYTRPSENEYTFNDLLIRGVDLTDNAECEYRIYIIPAGKSSEVNGYCPRGTLSDFSATIIKQGVLIKKSTGFQDYEIALDNPVLCPVGSQILFLLSGEYKISIKGSATGYTPSSAVVNRQMFSSSRGADIWTDPWYAGDPNYLAQSLWLYIKPYFVPLLEAEEVITPIVNEAVDDKIDQRIGSWLQIQIPNIIYAVVGTELNIWNDAVALSSDRGLSSPLNYQVRWQCNKGLITNRCFRYTPDAADAGSNVTCSCFVYDMDGVLASSKTFTIKVLAKNALQSARNIVYFGDSLGAGAANALYSDFNNSDKFSGVAPTMRGTEGTSPHYEAVGGYGWASYSTEGSPGYRAYVSGVTSISIGAIYSDGVSKFEVIEVNIVDGSGNILLRSHYTGTLIMPNGTLTKVSGGGDNTIPYTGAFQESSNPLWNDTTGKLDIQQYKSMIGLQSADKIDAVSFQFGINDHALANNTNKLMEYIDALYHCFVDDNPDCKFIIGLTTTSGNDLNGSGSNYGATFNWYDYLVDVYKIRQFYLTLQNSQEYPNIRIAPIGLEVDRYYGYAFSTRQISQRYTEEEQYHNNYVHPGASGYSQMGDAYFATYIGVLTE